MSAMAPIAITAIAISMVMNDQGSTDMNRTSVSTIADCGPGVWNHEIVPESDGELK